MKRIKQAFLLILAVSLVFPSNILPALQLAPAGVLGTTLEGEIAEMTEGAKSYFNVIIKGLKSELALTRRKAAEDLIKAEKYNMIVLNPLIAAIIDETDIDALEAELEALIKFSTSLVYGNPALVAQDLSYFLKNTEKILEHVDAKEYLASHVDIREYSTWVQEVLNTAGEKMTGLGNYEGAKEVFLTILQSAENIKNDVVCEKVAKHLYNMGWKFSSDPATVVIVFLNALKYGDADIRRMALGYLASAQLTKYLDSGVIGKLVDALRKAVIGMYKNKEEAATGAEEKVVNAVCDSLVEIGNKENVRGIISNLAVIKDKHVRYRLADVLLRVGRKIVTAKNNEGNEKGALAFAYALSYGENLTRVKTLKEISVYIAYSEQGKTKTDGYKEVINVLKATLKDPDESIRLKAIETCGNVGDPEFVEPLIWMLGIDHMGIESALAKIGGADAREALCNVVKRWLSWNTDARIYALQALGKMKEVDFETFKTVAKFTKSRKMLVASNAIATLCEFSKMAVVGGGTMNGMIISAIVDSLDKDKRTVVRLEAVKALGEVEGSISARALLSLSKALSDDADAVRECAADALRKRKKGYDALVRAFKKETNPQVEVAMAYALASAGNMNVVNVLSKALEEGKLAGEVSKNAVIVILTEIEQRLVSEGDITNAAAIEVLLYPEITYAAAHKSL